MKSDPLDVRTPFSRKLNFIIAVSAMLLSIASFYATYIQAKAADQQVKAMTYPLIQYSSGNYDKELKASVVNLNLSNHGVGPAIIKTVTFVYSDQLFHSAGEFLEACCEQELLDFKSSDNFDDAPIESQIYTSVISNIVLPMNSKANILALQKYDINQALWNKINTERFKLKVSVCYCSLLDNCYQTKEAGIINEVKSCS